MADHPSRLHCQQTKAGKNVRRIQSLKRFNLYRQIGRNYRLTTYTSIKCYVLCYGSVPIFCTYGLHKTESYITNSFSECIPYVPVMSHFPEDRFSSITVSCKVGVRPIMDRYEAKWSPTTFIEDPQLPTLIEIRVNNFGDEICEVTSRHIHYTSILYTWCKQRVINKKLFTVK